MRKIARAANVDKSTLSIIKKYLCNNDEEALAKVLNPATYKTGAARLLTAEEEVEERLIFTANRGFAIGMEVHNFPDWLRWVAYLEDWSAD